jgi:exopolysaccharide production protein ExoY
MFVLSTVSQVQAGSSKAVRSAAAVSVVTGAVASATGAALISHQALLRRGAAPTRQSQWSAKVPASFASALLIRALDILVALAALFVAAPMLVLIALAIKMVDRGPVFSIHQRIGQGGTVFGFIRFRSIAVDSEERLRRLLEADPHARAEWARCRRLRRDPRITALGQFLRRSSLDELPQLFNVLRGEMSLVGPRPIAPAEAGRYGRYFDIYCSLKPGLTGLWQVKRRHRASYRCRIAHDRAYARSRSLGLNLRILALAVPSFFLGYRVKREAA